MNVFFNDPNFQEYVNGKKFNPNFPFRFNFDLHIKNRDSELAKLVKNKKIIHVGCVDHLDIIESKIKNGTWLHKILMDSASRCLGVDVNSEGISYLRKNHHISDLVSADLVKDTIREIQEEEWDYILLPEVIEHIPDVVNFLKMIHDKYSKNIKKIIITVPNLFAYNLYLDASKNIERINSDHRFWFSPYTLTKILNDANIEVEAMYLINGFWGPFYCNTLARLTSRLFQLFGKKLEYKRVRDMRYAKGILAIAR